VGGEETATRPRLNSNHKEREVDEGEEDQMEEMREPPMKH
jgi:hypothetical protein